MGVYVVGGGEGAGVVLDVTTEEEVVSTGVVLATSVRVVTVSAFVGTEEDGWIAVGCV